MQTYANLFKLMQSHENLCNILQTDAKLMQTYANLCKLMQISFNLFFLNIFDLCSQSHSRKLRRRLTKISRGICVKIHRPESPLLPCLMEFVMKSQCPSLQRYPVVLALLPSQRLLGESQREELKRKAEHLSRSLWESFSFITSKTMSIKDTRDVIQTFGNVSWLDQASLLLFYSISSEDM